MDFTSYQEYALRTAQLEGRSPESLMIEAAMGISAEAGEFCDEVKKMAFHDHKVPLEKLLYELGDVLWYLNLAAYMNGVSLETVAIMNIKKLQERYPNGFDKQISQQRYV